MTVNFNDYITTIGTTSGAQTYTATKKCVGFYNYRAISGSYSASGVNVNGHPVFANVSVNMSDSIGAVKLELQAGDVVTFTNIQANANLLYVYGVL